MRGREESEERGRIPPEVRAPAAVPTSDPASADLEAPVARERWAQSRVRWALKGFGGHPSLHCLFLSLSLSLCLSLSFLLLFFSLPLSLSRLYLGLSLSLSLFPGLRVTGFQWPLPKMDTKPPLTKETIPSPESPLHPLVKEFSLSCIGLTN